jgi:hypothetical protein
MRAARIGFAGLLAPRVNFSVSQMNRREPAPWAGVFPEREIAPERGVVQPDTRDAPFS